MLSNINFIVIVRSYFVLYSLCMFRIKEIEEASSPDRAYA